MPDAGVGITPRFGRERIKKVNLLEQGRGELAFVLPDSIADAWSGDEEAGFKESLKKLRAIASTTPTTSRSWRAKSQASTPWPTSRANVSIRVHARRQVPVFFAPGAHIISPSKDPASTLVRVAGAAVPGAPPQR
ncbi:hypothetical protein D3C77_430950 [compost metagenome]